MRSSVITCKINFSYLDIYRFSSITIPPIMLPVHIVLNFSLYHLRFPDSKVCVPFKHFLGYDRGDDGGLVLNEKEAVIFRRIFELSIVQFIIKVIFLSFSRIAQRCKRE